MSGYSTTRSFFVSAAVFILLEGASLYILMANSTVQQSWFGRGFNNIKAALWSGPDHLISYFSLRRENDNLVRDNLELTRQLESIRRAASDRNWVWTPLRSRFEYLDANIVTMTSGSQHNYMIIDRGRRDGVEPDDGLITANGVVGVVQSVSEGYAYAVSYANVEMVVSAKAGREGSVGSLRWSGYSSGDSFLDGIPLHCPVETGDTVYTSGFSSMFPPDIPLGTVEEKNTRGGSSASFKIKLFEDFSSLHHVMVVRNPDRRQIEGLITEGQTDK